MHFWYWTPCILPEMLDEAVASFYQMWSDGQNLLYEQKRIQTEYCACKDKKMRKVIDLYLSPLQSQSSTFGYFMDEMGSFFPKKYFHFMYLHFCVLCLIKLKSLVVEKKRLTAEFFSAYHGFWSSSSKNATTQLQRSNVLVCKISHHSGSWNPVKKNTIGKTKNPWIPTRCFQREKCILWFFFNA